MLRSLKSLLGNSLQATDGSVGKVQDLYFDDEVWIIRYLVADTGNWLPGRLVLIATEALGQPEREGKEIPVGLTKEEIENSPSLDADKPISLQKEHALRAHFQWPPYWDLAGAPIARKLEPLLPEMTEVLESEGNSDPHLQNVNEVLNYNIQAVDGKIGHIEDFVIDDQTWNVRYMVVDTKNWLPGKKVLVDPMWIRDISWSDQIASIDLSQQKIEHCPEYDPSQPIERHYEEQLYNYYARTGYWK